MLHSSLGITINKDPGFFVAQLGTVVGPVATG